MKRYYYKKSYAYQTRWVFRLSGIIITVSGCMLLLYRSLPIRSWQLYFGENMHAFGFTSPVPKTSIVTKSTLATLRDSSETLEGVDYTNAKNWFPNYKTLSIPIDVPVYYLSIPKIHIDRAEVSTTDVDLSQHLIHYPGTQLPPLKGNAAIFGHSTLPQLYKPNNYKTIFANLYQLQRGDTFQIHIKNVSYTYRIFSISVTKPEETEVLDQDYDDSYVTIITCTPPGTVWYRLVLKARLEEI